MSQPRVASSIDVSLPHTQQKAVSTVAPLARPVQFTEEQVKSPKILTRLLTMIQQEVALVTRAVRSHPEQAPITFKNVKCPASGAKVPLEHNLGSFAEFIITKWSGNGVTSAPILVSDENDGVTALTNRSRLVLRSYVEGTATIRVYPGA